MALEGNLKDFALSEILQLISVQQKSGYLRLKTSDDLAEIWFEKGRIKYATREQYPLNEQIKNYLIKTGKLDRDIISKIETAAEQSHVSFEKVLVTGGYLTGEELTKVSSFLIEEMIHDLFKWQAGSYSFDASQKAPSSPANVSLKTEGLLMEGMRRIDEWPAIEQRLPSPKIIIKQGEADPEEFSLIDDELKIIQLAGQRGIPLGELAEISGLGKYRTYETVCNLMEVDLVSTVTFETKELKIAKKAKLDIGKILRPIGAFAGIIFFVMLGIAVIYGVRMGMELIGFSGKEASEADEAKVLNEVKNIQTALDLYLIENSRYPDSLEVLVFLSLITEDELNDDVWAFNEVIEDYSYRYRIVNGGLDYILETSMGTFESR